MKKEIIFETQRLRLHEFNIHDSKFILKQLNSPNWLAHIGDKNVKTEKNTIDF